MDTNQQIHSKNSGVVYKKMLGKYTVRLDGRIIDCDISARLRKELVYPTAAPGSLSHVVVAVQEISAVDPVAVGDEVVFVDNQDGTGLIVEVNPRRSKLARLNPGRKAIEQVIVANVDQVVAVFSAAQPAPKWNLLDRYLASAESLELPAVICINKVDLIGEGGRQSLDKEMEIYRKIGYRVIYTSTVTSEGLDELTNTIRGRLSVFIGKSGVGKTSLLNWLQPGLGLKVNKVSQATSKGKHTTTNLEMHALDCGGAVVDTPGMREFGLWDVNESELALFFPDLRPFVGRCKFGLNCCHVKEPGCAILNAVDTGKVERRRYQSYIRLRSGD